VHPANAASRATNNWLAEATANGWSYRELATAIKAAKPTPLIPMLAEEAKKRQGARTDLVESKGRTTCASPDAHVKHSATAAAADLMGIGKATVDRALRVQRESRRKLLASPPSTNAVG